MFKVDLDLKTVHRQQLAGVARATPAAMIGYAINVGVATAVFFDNIPGVQLFLWAVWSLLICGYVGLRGVRRARPAAHDRASETASARTILVFATLLASPWALLGAFWFESVGADGQIVLMALIVGMAASGGILLSPVPAAAILYVSIILFPMIFMLLFASGKGSDVALAALAMSFAVFLFVLIVTNARLFFERMRAVSQLQDSVRALSDSREETERATAVKSEFLATMSHEIRTPLNSILGYTELILSRGELRERDAVELTIVKEAGRSLLEVVNDILDFSSIEAGRLKLARSPIRLGGIVRSCVDIVSVASCAKHLHLKVEIDDAVAQTTVLADGQRIRQVLLNLLNNAIKFTLVGDVRVTAVATSVSATSMSVRFAVNDTGIGIAPEAHSSLFTRFTQLDTTPQRRFGGSGLGLAICKRIVEAKGGQIGVDSEQDVGSTFWFEVPFELTAAIAEPEPKPASKTIGKKLRVLVVDDMPANRKLTTAVLSNAGHDVTTAGSGREAVAHAADAVFDVILMDIQMPGMDGLSAAAAIRSSTTASPPPIVAMTANVLPAEVAKCRAAGMVAHIGKPFEWAELLRITQEAATSSSPDWVMSTADVPYADVTPASEDQMSCALR